MKYLVLLQRSVEESLRIQRSLALRKSAQTGAFVTHGLLILIVQVIQCISLRLRDACRIKIRILRVEFVNTALTLVRPRLDLDEVPTGWYAPNMRPQAIERSPSGGARSKLLDAAVEIIRRKGYAATSVDELCARAGVTKGAFFHHFPSKDSLAVTAANYWSELSNALFAAAPYHRFDDPLDRVLGYLDFRRSMLRGDVAEFSCLAGTLVQEAYETHPDIRVACDATIGSHAATVESDIAAAMKCYLIRAPWTAESLALHTQAVLQGAFILAKAKGNAAVAEASIDHLRRYVELLIRRPKKNAVRKIRPRRTPIQRRNAS